RPLVPPRFPYTRLFRSFDPKVYDPRRVLRLTNSIHSKSGRFSIPLTADELLGWSLDRLFEEAKGPRPIPEIKDVSLLPKARADLDRKSTRLNSSHVKIS